jgi:aryl-alcohol dehydrogenase-like predicted oxidoreductase
MGFGPGEETERMRTFHASVDAGVTTIDTAPLYGFGDSETLLGRALEGRRDSVELLSKVGLRWDDTHGEILFQFHDAATGQMRAVRRDSRPGKVVEEVEASLKRLRTDRLELVQIHHPDFSTPIEDTLGALSRLVEQGKILGIGLSNVDLGRVDQAQHALGSLPLAGVQNEYNLFNREVEAEHFPGLIARGGGLIGYYTVAQGQLAGKLLTMGKMPSDGREFGMYYAEQNVRPTNRALERVVEPLARKHDATIAAVVLAWLIGEPGATAAIVGAGSPKQARDNARAMSLELSFDERTSIRRAFEAIELVRPKPSFGTRLVRRVKGKLSRLRDRFA